MPLKRAVAGAARGVVEFLSCRDDAERGRLLDLSHRLRPVERRALVVFAIAAVVALPTYGAIGLLPMIPALAAFWVVQRRLECFRRPELVSLSCLALFELGLAVALSVASGPRVFLLPVMIMPVLLASVVFPVRVAALFVAFGSLLMLGVGLGADMSAVRQTPFALIFPLEVMICQAGIAMIVAGLDLSTRVTAIVDPLTAMPNRVALRARVAELEHQSRVNHRPVAVIVGDADDFKDINDMHGHALGDAVLREIASRLRGEFGSNVSGYRLGGEEFVVLVTDADAEACSVIAERMRRAVGVEAIEGMTVRMSFGVAASAPGGCFSFSDLFGKADGALYEAKATGGNRAGVWTEDGRVTLVATQQAAEAQAGVDPACPRPALERGVEPVADAHRAQALANAPLHGERPGIADRWERWTAEQHAATGNWLLRDDVQRSQLLELNRRLREKAMPCYVVGFLFGGLSAIWYGWWIVLPPLAMAIVYVLVEHRIERMRHPEYGLGLGWLGFQVSYALSGVTATHPMIFAAPLLMVLLVGSSAVFPPRGVLVGALVTAAIMVGVGFTEDPALIENVPAILAFDFALVATMGLLGIAVGRSTMAYRDLAVVDPLTGLLNRGALTARIAELSHQSLAAGTQVAVIVADIDRFKPINDRYGHATGDQVLREIGERIRNSLRAFESAYRLGGEEFAILLEGVDATQAGNVAGRVCTAISGAAVAGVPVTASFGVAVSRVGRVFDYEAVFRSADAVMYEAKRAGGNRVITDRRPVAGEQQAASKSAIGDRAMGAAVETA